VVVGNGNVRCCRKTSGPLLDFGELTWSLAERHGFDWLGGHVLAQAIVWRQLTCTCSGYLNDARATGRWR